MSRDIRTLDDLSLSQLRAEVAAEMQRRGLPSSVGEIGELLAIAHYCHTRSLPNLQKAPAGTKNVDALSRTGERYSIKTVCRGKKTGTVYPDQGNPGKQLFESLLIVRISEHWSLESIHELPWDLFCEVRAWDKRMNAWYVPISGRSLATARLVFDSGLKGSDR